MRKQKSDSSGEKKEQEATFANKLQQFVLGIFTIDARVLPKVGVYKLAIVYYQIAITGHAVLQHTLFAMTNNRLYAILTTVLVLLQILFGLLLRFSTKHFVFRILMWQAALAMLGRIGCIAILAKHYHTFEFFCEFLAQYSRTNVSGQFQAAAVCANTSSLYQAQLAEGAAAFTVGIVMMVLMGRAYQSTKQAEEDQRTKKRRKDRYNELLLRKQIYHEKRKV